jgi:hypothetical protein
MLHVHSGTGTFEDEIVTHADSVSAGTAAGVLISINFAPAILAMHAPPWRPWGSAEGQGDELREAG